MKKIFLNPGHTPQWQIDAGMDWDVGTSGNGMQENVVAAEVCKLIEQESKNFGIEVVKNFQSMSLREITDVANSTDADIFVSVHCNGGSPSAKGAETFYCQGSSTGKKIASLVQKNIVADLNMVDRGVKDDTQTQHSRIHVLRASDMPAILIELGFMSNTDDAKLLRDNKMDFARAILKGLSEHLGLETEFDEKTKIPAPDVVDKLVDAPEENIDVIASLSHKYESNGDPACVSSGAGDLGGRSYGKYQLASNLGNVDTFVDWLCENVNPTYRKFGNQLAQFSVNSPQFIDTWKHLDKNNFGRAQDAYIKSVYYDAAVKGLKLAYFNVDKHSEGLKAVIFARAVQNGVTGCVKLFEAACNRLGYPNLSYVDDIFFDEKLISAIYEFLISECDLAKPDYNSIWRSPNNFCRGSKSVINGLRNRFVNEKIDAIKLI